MDISKKHTQHSSFREKMIEHLFVGELLKISWEIGKCDLEVAKPDVDNSGYDVILDSNQIIRHIQLKSSYVGSKTSRQKVHVKLGDKPSGCVIWVYFNEKTLELGPFYYFGSKSGEPLPLLVDEKIAKHSKGDSVGNKAERPNIRELNKGQFVRYDSCEQIYDVLFNIVHNKNLQRTN